MSKGIRKSFELAQECQHGGRVREAAALLEKEPLDFSANINPLGSPPIEELVLRELVRIGHYPDNNYIEFSEAAARFVAVQTSNIVPGNGSSEVIRLFAEATLEEGDLALIPSPTFGEYENQSTLMGARIRHVQMGKDGLPLMRLKDLQEAKALFLCNPNNPTGLLLSKGQVEKLMDYCEKSETFLLVDEAFIELSDPEQSVAQAAPEKEFLLVMRSLTKSFGVPGLRLGFGVTNDALAAVLNRARIPWSISSIAAAAATHLLGCTEHLERSRALIQEEIAWLTSALQNLGLEPLPSRVNFILVNIQPCGLDSDNLAERTMAQGVLVRDCQSFGLGKKYIRVAVRTREENKQLITALERTIAWRD